MKKVSLKKPAYIHIKTIGGVCCKETQMLTIIATRVYVSLWLPQLIIPTTLEGFRVTALMAQEKSSLTSTYRLRIDLPKIECDFNTFLCGSCDYSGKFATIITRSAQKCVKITFHFLQYIDMSRHKGSSCQ